jgi:hypothetical protein
VTAASMQGGGAWAPASSIRRRAHAQSLCRKPLVTEHQRDCLGREGTLAVRTKNAEARGSTARLPGLDGHPGGAPEETRA